jgi:hypothetical protein
MLRDDSSEVWTWRILYSITEPEFSAAYKVVVHEQTLEMRTTPPPPTDYQVLSTNCTWFAAKVAAAAGQTMPDYLYNSIPDPGTFLDSLQASGDGSTLNGGEVGKNPN